VLNHHELNANFSSIGVYILFCSRFPYCSFIQQVSCCERVSRKRKHIDVKVAIASFLLLCPSFDSEFTLARIISSCHNPNFTMRSTTLCSVCVTLTLR
jgi:hypothetical protein